MLITDIVLCDDTQEIKTNIRITNGLIADIGDSLKAIDNEETISYANKNMAIMPYFYDLNVRVKNNLFEIKNISKLLKKANKSGIKRVSIVPNCTPAINSELALGVVKFYDEVLPICHSEDNNDLSAISTLVKKGSMGIYLDSLDSNTIRRVCEYSLIDNVPIFCKSYDYHLSDGFMHNGLIASQMGVEGIDNIAEISQVAKMIQIGEFFKTKIVFNAITSSKSINLINDSKKQNNFFVQTPIHHLIFTDLACQDFNTIAKIFPPLKDEKERENLLQLLIDGKIDILTSIQAHENKMKKDLPFQDASYGINEINIYFAICYTYLVKNKLISLSHLSRLLSANAQKVFNIKPIVVEKNEPISNFVLVDLDYEFTVENNNSLYKNCNLSSKILSLDSLT